MTTVLAFSLVASACGSQTGGSGSQDTVGSEPVKGGVLRVALASIPGTIDPYATSLQADWTAARQVCEPLFDVSSTFEVKPVLVDDFDYDGDLTYTFTLRQGVKFQDGQPLTSKDVISSLKRYLLTPGNGSILKGLTDSLTAESDTKLTLKLTGPSAVVPTLLTTAYIMPASVQDGRAVTDAANQLTCTGPYKLTDYQPDQQITLDRWDGYVSRTEPAEGYTGAKNAYPDQIVLTPLPETSTRRQAVETGQVDIGIALPLDDYEALKSSGSARAELSKPQSGSTVVFNKTSGWMSKIEMRQAFLAALNMDEVMAAGFGNPELYTVDNSLIPAVNAAWRSDAGAEFFNKPDQAKVTSLLQESGYKGETIVWLTTKDDFGWFAPALPAVQELKDAGINIDLQVVDRATIIQRRTKPGQFDLFSSGIPTYADPVLLPYLQETFPGTWVSKERDTLLKALAAEPDQAKRKATWDKLQALVWVDVPFLKFGTSRSLAAVSSRTHNANPDDYGAYYVNTWVSE